MSENFSRIRRAQANLHELMKGIDQNEGMPVMLAPHAVATTQQAVAPLQGLEGFDLPERIRELGRRARDTAQTFADDPGRDTLAAWRVAVEQLAQTFSATDLRKRARASDGTGPRPAQTISPDKIYPGMAEAEARGVPSIPFSRGGGQQ